MCRIEEFRRNMIFFVGQYLKIFVLKNLQIVACPLGEHIHIGT